MRASTITDSEVTEISTNTRVSDRRTHHVHIAV